MPELLRPKILMEVDRMMTHLWTRARAAGRRDINRSKHWVLDVAASPYSFIEETAGNSIPSLDLLRLQSVKVSCCL